MHCKRKSFSIAKFKIVGNNLFNKKGVSKKMLLITYRTREKSRVKKIIKTERRNGKVKKNN